MIPQTVPNRPIKGAVEPVVARKVRYFSRRVISEVVARRSAREILSIPPRSVLMTFGLFSFVPLFHQFLQFAEPFTEEDRQGGIGKTVKLGVDGVETLRLPEKIQESFRLAVRPVDLAEFIEDDAEGDNGKRERITRTIERPDRSRRKFPQSDTSDTN